MDEHLDDLLCRLRTSGSVEQAVRAHLAQDLPAAWRTFVARCLHRVHRGGAQALLSAAHEEGGAIAEAAMRCELLHLRRIDRVRSRRALLWVLEGHRSAIRAVCSSALGLASLSQDGEVRLWDITVGTSRVIADGALALAASDNGAHLVAAVEGRLLWFGEDGEHSVERASPEGTCAALAVSAKGACLWGDARGALVRIEPKGDEEPRSLTGHRDRITGVAFVSETIAVSGSLDRTMRLWDLTTGEPIRAHHESDERAKEDTFALGVHWLAVTRDRTRAIAQVTRQTRDMVDYFERDCVLAWEFATGALTEHEVQPDALVETDRGVLLASFGKLSWLSDPATEILHAGASARGSIGVLCPLPDGRVVTGGSDGILRCWDLSIPEESARSPLPAQEVFFAPGSREPVFVHGSFNGGIYLHPPPGGEARRLPHRAAFHGSHVIDAKITPDRGSAVATGHAFVAQWITAASGGLIEQGLPPHHVARVALGPDGETLLLNGKDHGAIAAVRGEGAGRVLYESPSDSAALAVTREGRPVSLHGDGVLRVPSDEGWREVPLGLSRVMEGAVGCSEDGAFLYVFAGRAFLVVDRETGAVRRTKAVEPAHQADLLALADGTVVVVGWSELQRFDPRSLKLRSSLTVASGIREARPHPDGKRLLVLAYDGRVTSWELATGAMRELLGARAVGCEAIALGPQGDLLATGDADGVVRVWGLRDGALETELRGCASAAGWLAFAEDGAAVVAVSNGAVTRWSMPDGSITHTFKIHPPSPRWDPAAIRRRVAGTAERLVVVGGVTHTRAWSLPDGAPRGVIPWAQETVYGGVPIVRPGGTGGAIVSGNQLRVVGPQEELLHELKVNGQFATAGFGPDGERILAAYRPEKGSSTITWLQWDLRTGAREDLVSREAALAAVHPDGETVLWAYTDGGLERRGARDDRLVQRFVGHREAVTAVCFSQDGGTLVTVSRDRSLRRWDVETGVERARYEADEGLRACAIGEDGTIAYLDDVGGYGILRAR